MNPIRTFCNWFFSRKAFPHWCILALDCFIVIFSWYFVYYIKFGAMSMVQNFWTIFTGIAVSLLAFIASFFFFHTSRGMLRYSSFVDLQRLALTNICSCAVICLLHQFQVHLNLSRYILIPRFGDIIIIYVLVTGLMWIVRVMVKSLFDNFHAGSAQQNIFIYGCLQGGISLAKSVRAETPARYNLVGFVSGEQSMNGSWLLGVPVYYDDDQVVDIMRDKKASVILISPLQSQRFSNRTSLIDALIDANIKIMMMPLAEEWDGKSDISYNQLHEVDIEDLLPRKEIEVDMVAIGSMLRGKRVLITGAAGSIGSEISRQVAKFYPSKLILIDQAETPMHDMRMWMDNFFHKASDNSDESESALNTDVFTIVSSITDQEHMERIFSEHRPKYVFHAAAYKHVPMMEDNPTQAVRNNVFGTRVIADLAVKYGTSKFVMLSTDKAVNPTNVMGCSKRICEIYCQSLNYNQKTTQFVTTRFGNVLGSNGSVIPIFREQIRKGGPVKVTHPDIIRYFMLISEACRLVLEAGTIGKGGEIFVFDMGEPVKIVDLARRMIALSGANNVKIEFSGLRDGEKLYEELLANKENTKPTVHPKIMVAQVRQYPYELALKHEMELYEISKSFDNMAIVRKMKEIVPEYKSEHSQFERLD